MWFGLPFILFLIPEQTQAVEAKKAGKCEPGKIYNEMTLKGGINAGTYKDVGGVKTMEECQQKCCQFPACDLAFMLAGSCYLVGCKDQKQCQMQLAKESSFKPMISYVTRWNGEGVKHAVVSNGGKEKHYTCTKMNPISKVTLKGGLQAGDFTDIGRVGTIAECYDTCCQQEKCDLAFMLGQNCFTVVCKDKKMCVTTPAQPSIFNPQIAYVSKRGLSSLKSDIPKETNSGCPNTRVLENMTLKGGVDAGAYKDHGKVKDMSLCRRICCEMTDCHLAFMLGETCFSVKCSNMDSCRAQKSKPSTYAPKISYVRKVNTNELLPSYDPSKTPPPKPAVVTTTTTQKPEIAALSSLMKTNEPSTSKPPAVDGIKPDQLPAAALSALDSISNQGAATTTTSTTPQPTTTSTSQQPTTTKTTPTTVQSPSNDLLSALQKADPSPENAVVKSASQCKAGAVKHGVTLKGGRKSGDFVERKDVKTMKECSARCCNDPDRQCNLAFMLGETCYSVKCTDKELCRTVKAPPTKFNPVVQYVRGLDDLENAVEEPATTKATTTESTTASTTTTLTTTLQPSCLSQPVVRGKSIRGGKRAGKFKIFRAIKDFDSCVAKCCSLKGDCDVAYMEDSNCYSIQCFKKSACTAIPLRDTDVNPVFAYMDHFLDKVDAEEVVESETTLELDQTEPNACGSKVEIIKDKTLKGGTKAGKFHPLGKKSMQSCISSCCDRPHCDVAYLLNGHCYSVQCTDSKLCQPSDHIKHGDTVQLAYMNKAEAGDKKRDYLVIYAIISMVVMASIIGGVIWFVFAYKRKQKIEETQTRLLEPEDEEETIDNIMHKKPSSRSRYRQPSARY